MKRMEQDMFAHRTMMEVMRVRELDLAQATLEYENMLAAWFKADAYLRELENSMDSCHGVDALAASTQGMNLSD